MIDIFFKKKSPSPLVRVSGDSPYRDCKIGGPGRNFLNAEVEPRIDVNPKTVRKNNINLVGVWQQDRWDTGGAHGLVAAYSFDSGSTWGTTTLPFSACAPGGLNYHRASDPWISFGPDGTAYVSALLINVSTDGRRSTGTAIAAATSTDGGRTWGNINIIKADTRPFTNDKETVTADPARPCTAYVVWHRLTPDAGHTWFARTIDGGRTWSQPEIIFFPGENNQTIGNQIVVNPRTGILYNFFKWIIRKEKRSFFYVAFQESADGGETWLKPKVIARFQSVGVTDPNTGALIRTGGSAIPEPVIDPVTGKLYVVWQDARFSDGKYDEVAISYSCDGGQSWSEAARVNPSTGKPAFTPAISVNSAGTVGVSYYDFRSLTKRSGTLPTDYWFTISTDGKGRFAREIHVTGPFNMLAAPFIRPPSTTGYFLGDYQGLVAAGKRFFLFFAKTNPGNGDNLTDIVFTAVDL